MIVEIERISTMSAVVHILASESTYGGYCFVRSYFELCIEFLNQKGVITGLGTGKSSAAPFGIVCSAGNWNSAHHALKWIPLDGGWVRSVDKEIRCSVRGQLCWEATRLRYWMYPNMCHGNSFRAQCFVLLRRSSSGPSIRSLPPDVSCSAPIHWPLLNWCGLRPLARGGAFLNHNTTAINQGQQQGATGKWPTESRPYCTWFFSLVFFCGFSMQRGYGYLTVCPTLKKCSTSTISSTFSIWAVAKIRVST